MQRIFELAFNQGDLGIVDELVAADGVTHTGRWGMPAGQTGLKMFIAAFRSGFPDLRCTIEDEIRQGDRMAAHWTLRGTHQGHFLGSPPTGRPVLVQGILYARIRDGQIIENWILVDQMGILQQLGIIPPISGNQR